MTELAEKIRLLEMERQAIAQKPKFADEIKGARGLSQKEGQRLRFLESRVQILEQENSELKEHLRVLMDEQPPLGETDADSASKISSDDLDAKETRIAQLEARITLLEHENKALKEQTENENISCPPIPSAEVLLQAPVTQEPKRTSIKPAPVPEAPQKKNDRKNVVKPEIEKQPLLTSAPVPNVKTAGRSPAKKVAVPTIKKAPAFLNAQDVQNVLQKALPSVREINYSGNDYQNASDYRYYGWQTNYFSGYIEQKLLGSAAQYNELFTQYIDFLRQSCPGRFQYAMRDIEIGAVTSAPYDIYCDNGNMSYVETMLFHHQNGIMTVLSIKTPPQNQNLGLLIRDQAKITLEER